MESKRIFRGMKRARQDLAKIQTRTRARQREERGERREETGKRRPGDIDIDIGNCIETEIDMTTSTEIDIRT
jgi:hypothetical protein